MFGRTLGTRLFDASVPATTNIAAVPIDVTKMSRLVVVVTALAAAAVGDVTASVDHAQPDGTVYNADNTPSAQPPVARTSDVVSTFGTGSTLMVNRTFFLDVSALSKVFVRARNTTAGPLTVRIDAWGVQVYGRSVGKRLFDGPLGIGADMPPLEVDIRMYKKLWVVMYSPNTTSFNLRCDIALVQPDGTEYNATDVAGSTFNEPVNVRWSFDINFSSAAGQFSRVGNAFDVAMFSKMKWKVSNATGVALAQVVADMWAV